MAKAIGTETNTDRIPAIKIKLANLFFCMVFPPTLILKL
jgi:hypothetical protein